MSPRQAPRRAGDAATKDRADMVSAMTADEWSWLVAFIAGYAPQIFDAAVAARSPEFADELAARSGGAR